MLSSNRRLYIVLKVELIQVTGELKSHPQLELLGLIINQKHKILLCKTCEHMVNPAAIRDHLKSHTNKYLPTQKEINPALHIVKEMLTSPERPIILLPPIEGLKLHKDYYGCPSCNQAWGRKPGLTGCSNGACTNHGKSAGWFTTWAQRFKNNSNSPYFAVLPPATTVPQPLPQTSLYELYDRTRERLSFDCQHSIQAQDLMKRKYIVDMGWEKLLEHLHLTQKEASEIFSYARDETAIRNYLTRNITDMLSDMQDNLQSILTTTTFNPSFSQGT